MTVYAKWSYQSTTTLTVTRTGYTFHNWKYTGTYNKNQLVKNNVSITPHLDAVLNAQWTANNYVITTVPDPEKNKTQRQLSLRNKKELNRLRDCHVVV